MGKIINTCIVLCSAFVCLASVNAQTINGKITDDSNGEPIEYATVILQTTDSLYVNATYTDTEGVFLLPIDIKAYRLVVQHLVYETYERNYSSDENDIVIKLTAKENTLDDIVVKGEKPIVKLIDGKITYDMPLLLSGTTVSNAYESMLRLPGVREQNGALILAGASSVTVIINGKVTAMSHENLMAALKMYPAEMIQSAEIMYSTPPQYHIRGAAINLVLKGDNANSLQGQVNAEYAQKHYANYTGGISLLISLSKTTLDFNYAFNREQEKSGVDIHSNHLYNETTNLIEQFNRGNRKSNINHIRFGIDHKLSENNNLNLVYTSQIANKVNNNESSKGTFSLSNNHKENKSPIQMHDVLMDYSSGFGLKVGVEYTLYNTHTDQQFSERMINKENEFTADAKQEINRYRFFADQSNLLPSEWKLNYGVQYMYATDKSLQLYRSPTGNDMSEFDMSNQITEHTANTYIGVEKNISNRLSVSASVTGEYYALTDFKEWTIFPALEMTYFISPSQIMQLSFSSDKIYPAYWEMHGAVSYLNGYSEIHGNPLLKPYRSYSSQFNYIFKSKYVLTAFYSYLDGYSMQLPYQAHDRLVLIYKTLNFDYKQTAGLNLIIPFNIRERANTRLTLMGFYDKVKSSHFHDISFNKNNIVFYTRLDNTINISSKPNIKAEVNGAYISKNIQGPAELTPLWSLDIGLKWTFFHDMAELKLKGSDLFNKWTPDMSMKYDTQNLKMNIIPDTRAVSLSFVFKFGGYDRTHKAFDTSRFGTE
jgi:hypothetical protein